jgi:hypothetical protein
MIGRNKNWTGPSDWIKEFNKVHNPGIFEDEKKTNQKKIQKKNNKQKNNPSKFKIFRV